MVNSISHFQDRLDRCASIGLSICQASKSEKTSSVYTIGVNILIGGVGIAAACACPPAAPIILGVTALGLIAYNVYAIYQRVQQGVQQEQRQKRLTPFEPVFSNICAHQYDSAWNQLKDILHYNSDDDNDCRKALLKFENLFNESTELLKRGVQDPEFSFYRVLFCYLALMKAHGTYHDCKDPHQQADLLKTLTKFVKSHDLLRSGGLGLQEVKELIQSNELIS